MEIPTLPLPSPPPQTPTTTTTTTTVKTPDPESEAPQSTKQLSLPLTTNGILKRHKPLHHHQPPPLIVVTYKECLKNHAAVMGGHAVDGCGEFMPSPSSSPSYPTSLKCAACGCHRNFHRREPEESLFSPPIQHVIEYQPHHRHHPPPPPPPQTQPKPQPQQLLPLPPPPPTGDDVSPGNSPSPPPISSSYYPSAPHMLLALSTGLPSPPVENNHTPTTGGSGAGSGSYPNGKKRFRTKFTQDQKGKMHEIAERIGWKMQKRDEDMINGFCNEIGVEKNVFKVWMHNNKITNIGNNNNNNSVFINNGNGNGNGNDNHISTAEQVNRGIDFMISRNNNEHDLHIRNIDSFSTGGNLVATKGSSST